MTNAIRPTPPTSSYATPENSPLKRVSVLTPNSETPTKRRLFDSPNQADSSRRDLNVKAQEKARPVLSSISVPQTPRKAPSLTHAGATPSAFSPNGLFLPDSSAFSPAVVASSIAKRTLPKAPTPASATALFSPNGLFLPEQSAFSQDPLAMKAHPQATPLKAAAALENEVPSNEMILTRLFAPTPEAIPIERANAINLRMDKFKNGKLSNSSWIQKAVKLTEQTTFIHNGIPYTKGKLLGKGQFFATFETDKPGVVVKVLHEDAIFFDAFSFLKPNFHWEALQANYAAAAATGLLARVLNGDTLSKDMFMLQETVTPLDHLTQQLLKTLTTPLFPQIKHILSTFLKQGIVIECQKKNLGISSSKKVVVHDFDTRTNFDYNKGNKESALAANFKDNVASYGPAAAAYLAAN